MNGTGSIYALKGVSVSIARPRGGSAMILRELDITISPGEQIAIVGPSGAGKTTLLHTLALAREPTAGTFIAFAVAPWRISNRARHSLRARLFLAPQVPPLPPRQRVVTAVLAGLLPKWTLLKAFKSLLYPETPERAAQVLEGFGLKDRLYERVERLSGGERQRISLARMLLAAPEVLLVDEPLSALDPTLAEKTLQALCSDAQKRAATLVCSLHQVELALAFFPRIIGLRSGALAFDLPRDEVSPEVIARLYAELPSDRLDAELEPIRSPGISPTMANAHCR